MWRGCTCGPSLRNASTPQGTGLFLVKRWGTGTAKDRAAWGEDSTHVFTPLQSQTGMHRRSETVRSTVSLLDPATTLRSHTGMQCTPVLCTCMELGCTPTASLRWSQCIEEFNRCATLVRSEEGRTEKMSASVTSVPSPVRFTPLQSQCIEDAKGRTAGDRGCIPSATLHSMHLLRAKR